MQTKGRQTPDVDEIAKTSYKGATAEIILPEEAMIKFTLVMCIYEKENPAYFTQCLESILAQTVLPDELIIVEDGPLTVDLGNVIQNLQFPRELNIISLPENVTQGPARAEGVKAAKHDWIAIMDSDDVCRPDRFKKQLEMIENNPELELIGAQIAEFPDIPANTISVRTVPQNHTDIVSFAKKRNPFNQMTVMFKRDHAISAGNYRYFPWFEDYDLWVRMINNGSRCANHPDILVDARVGSGMYGRRRGLSYAQSEWRMQQQLFSLGSISKFEFFRNVATRIPVRLLPEKWVENLYGRYAR